MNTKATVSYEELFLATFPNEAWEQPDRQAIERARAIADRDEIDQWREKEALRQERSAAE